MNWNNIGGNLAAIYVYALGMFPGLDAHRIWAAILDRTIFLHVGNLFIMWLLYRFGKEPNVQMRYIPQ